MDVDLRGYMARYRAVGEKLEADGGVEALDDDELLVIINVNAAVHNCALAELRRRFEERCQALPATERLN